MYSILELMLRATLQAYLRVLNSRTAKIFLHSIEKRHFAGYILREYSLLEQVFKCFVDAKKVSVKGIRLCPTAKILYLSTIYFHYHFFRLFSYFSHVHFAQFCYFFFIFSLVWVFSLISNLA